MINTIVKERKSLYIEFSEFSEEDLKKLGIEEGDRFEAEASEDGKSLILKKFESIEIDLSLLSKEELISLIQESAKRQISVGEVFNEAIESIIAQNKDLTD